MIYSNAMSETTQQLADKMYDAAEKVREKISREVIKKITDSIYEEIWTTFDTWFCSNMKDTYLENISYEVRYILREFLNGNFEIMKKCNLFSEYTFDNLHEIRLSIWKAGATEIETSIITAQKKQIEALEKELDFARRRNHV